MVGKKYNNRLTCTELVKILQEAIDKHGDIPIYFDTEARTFNYHMALISRAFIETLPEKHIALLE
jgi:hypothetical protein